MKNSVQALLSCFPIAELYKSRSQTNLFECFDSEYRTFSSEIKGCALRVYNKTQTEGKMYIKHGTLSIDDYFVNTIENTIPYMLLPQKKIKAVTNYDFDRKHKISQQEILSLYSDIQAALKGRKLKLHGLSIENHLTEYSLSNSYGVQGDGITSFFNVHAIIRNPFGDFIEYAKKYIGETLTTVLDEITGIPIEREAEKVFTGRIGGGEPVLLTSVAVGELLYTFLLFMCDSMFVQSANYIKNNLDYILSQPLISPLITIEENSPFNQIVEGLIDGEGSERVPTLIVSKGQINTLLAGMNGIDSFPSTGSAFRFNYTMLPAIKATKIYMYPGIRRIDDYMQSCDTIAVINSIQGLHEGFNRETFDFSGILNARIYKYGTFVGRTTIPIKSNLIGILKSICIVFDKCEYTGDGSILAPSVGCYLSNLGVQG